MSKFVEAYINIFAGASAVILVLLALFTAIGWLSEHAKPWVFYTISTILLTAVVSAVLTLIYVFE